MGHPPSLPPPPLPPLPPPHHHDHHHLHHHHLLNVIGVSVSVVVMVIVNIIILIIMVFNITITVVINIIVDIIIGPPFSTLPSGRVPAARHDHELIGSGGASIWRLAVGPQLLCDPTGPHKTGSGNAGCME